MIFLYQRTGQAIQVEPTVWSEVLATARKWGWQPAGTQAPPAAFDLGIAPSIGMPWDHCYERPEGQTVGCGDAQSLALAIDTARTKAVPAEAAKSGNAWEIARFCALGSFLICADPAMTLPDNHIDSTQSLLSLSSALELPVAVTPAAAPEGSQPAHRNFEAATVRSPDR